MTKNKPILTPDGWRYETTPNQHRRHRSHDYSAVGTYLITMTISQQAFKGAKASFGTVIGEVRAPRNSNGRAHLQHSLLGEAVIKEELKKINKYYPMVHVWHFCLMPDHIHMILRVDAQMPPKKHLGHVIGAFKGGISRAWWRLQDEGLMPKCPAYAEHTGANNNNPSAAPNNLAVPPVSRASACDFKGAVLVSRASACDSRPPLFDDGYNDHILMRDGQLENWKAYLDDNPHRLLLRKHFPDIMERRLCITIAGIRFSAFGNFALLMHPEKVQGQCHVKARYGDLTKQERQQYGYNYLCAPELKTSIAYEQTQHFRDNLLRTMTPVRNGNAVLVTPGISEGEKQMKNEALSEGLYFIHLQKEPITERWKPEKSRFYACTAGNLLILAPWQEDMSTEGYYATFHRLNDIALMICELNIRNTDEYKLSIAS